MHVGPGTEATFVAGDVGRDGVVALWEAPADTDARTDAGDRPDADARTGSVTIGFPEGPRRVPADEVRVADVIGPLAALPAATEVRPSVRALSVATRLALDLVSRGRLLPTVADDGSDTWRIGPLDVDDRTRLEQLADALPPAAHAVPIGDGDLVASPHAAVTAFLDAVADAFVRTASAPALAGSQAYAGQGRTDVTAVESWLHSVTAGTGGDTLLGLRVELPTPPPASEDDLDELDEPVEPLEPFESVESPVGIRCVLQVQSRIDPSLVLDAGDLWAAPAAVLARFGTDVETDLLLALRRAATVWPPITRLLQESAPTELELADDEVEDLFGPIADDLAAAGLPVLWPSELFAVLELRPVVGTATPDPVAGAGSLDLSTLGEVRWDATVDGEGLTEAELLQLAEAKRPVVRLRGRWVRADPARLRKLAERTTVGLGDVLAAALSGTVSVDGHPVEAELVGPLVDLADRLQRLDSIKARPAPVDLHAELRPYQERGLAWLAEMAELGLGGVLADDMGLGKTVQVLALHVLRHAEHPATGPTLVICPATLMANWEREAARFVPGVPVHRYHGSDRDLRPVLEASGDEIVVCTYGIARRDAAELAAVPWGLVVADEAQAIKNPLSRTARALRTVPSGARFALTGTPVENRLSDLWALLDWTTPGLLGDLDTFQREVATPIERERDEEATARLAAVVQPFLLRRRKSDPHIAPDLPPKTETDHFVGLTVEQATLYKAVVAELHDDIAEAEGINRRGLVLKLLTALKQICNHPAQYLGQAGPIVGRSGKLAAATDLLSVVVDEGEAALVFTQYVGMGRLLTAHLDSLGIGTQFLHGSVPVGQREEMVDRFQAGEVPVFVVSLKAGGTGLNLTRATHVFHYDRWWNPAVEDQASDRAWRIGQVHPVQVHRLVCEGTLEERIATVLETKRALADSVIVGGETWVSELSDDELWALIELGGEAG